MKQGRSRRSCRLLGFAWAAALFAPLQATGCGGDDNNGPIGPTVDGGPDVSASADASADHTLAHDAGADAPREAADATDGATPPPAEDAGDAGEDAATEDSGIDAAEDAGVDAANDAGTDAAADAGEDAGVDAPVESDAGDAATDAGEDAGVDAGTDAGSGSDANTDAPPSCGAACPLVCGSASALGAWSLPDCPAMSATTTTGVYQLTVSLPQGMTEYKILPDQSYDGTELGSICGCNGGAFTSSVGSCSCNMAIEMPAAGSATIYYDTRALDSTYAPVPTSHGDDATPLYTPSGGTQRWIALGTFQQDLGAGENYSPCYTGSELHDDGLNGDAVAGDGIYTLEFVASRAYTATNEPPSGSDDQWKAISYQTDAACDFAGTTKLGGNGWSYDSSSAFCAADSSHYCADASNVGLTAAMGKTVHLELDAHDGHLRTTTR